MSSSWLTIKEVAEALKVHEVTIRRRIADGRLPAARLGEHGQLRVRSSDALRLLEPVRPGGRR